MSFFRKSAFALTILNALLVAACATKPEPLLECSQNETNQWAKQNVMAIAKGGSVYPEASLEARESGVVRVAVDFLSPDARHSVSLARSSGHAALDEAAMKRLGEADLTTPVCGGKSARIRIIMPMRFDIDEGE